MRKKSIMISITYSIMAIITFLAALNNSSIIKLPITFELLIQFFCYGYCLVFFVKNAKLPKYIFLILFLVLLLVLYTCYISKIYTILSSFVIFLMSMLLDYKKMTKYILFSLLIVISIHLFYGLIISPEYILYRNTHRYLLGFYSPNSIGTLALWAFLSFSYINDFDRKKCTIGYLLILSIYFLTNSRSLLLCSSLFYIYILLFQNNEKVDRINFFVSKYCVLFFSFLFVVLIALYNSNNAIALKIDDMMSGRLFYSDYAVENNGYTFFPKETIENPVFFKTSYNFIIDVGYVLFLYRYGIIYLIILELIGTFISKQKNKYFSLLFIIWSIDLCLESFGINFAICFSPIFASKYLLFKSEKENS